MIKTFSAVALGLLSTQIAFAADPVTETGKVPVAFAELKSGHAQKAIDALQNSKDVDANDPSRLINLGTAYARMGRTAEAALMFKAAMRSDIRYDLQLADGSTMDSRAAARLALQKLTKTIASH